MESRRWREIERLYYAAASLPASGRARFLEEACGTDHDLRHEIETLLDQDATAASFLAHSPLGGAASGSPPERESADRPAHVMPLWARAVVVIASFRSAAALALYLSQGSEFATPNPPPWLYALLSAIFAVFGLALTFGHKRDARAAWLGGMFATVGAQLSTLLLKTGEGTSFLGLEFLRVDAFEPAFLWYFLYYFPATLTTRWRVVLRRIAAAAALVAVVCVVLNLLALIAPAFVPGWADVFLITTKQPGRTYWLLIYGMTLPALVVLLVRAITATGQARQRAATFVIGLLAGFGPFTIEVVAEELVPAYKQWAHGPAVEPAIGAVIFGALGLVPFITGYSVLFDRVVEVRVVLRTAAQYVLARYSVAIMALVPFAALAMYLVAHREEQIGTLAAGSRPLLLAAFAATGLVAFRLRTRWLHALDKRYFREAYDARDIVTRLASEWQPPTAESWAGDLAGEIDRAIHAAATVFAVDVTGSVLRAVNRAAPDLLLSSTIARLTFADARPMDVDPSATDSALSRVQVDERHWLSSGNFRLLLAIKRGRVPIGLMALSAKQSELSYTADDRKFLMAIGSTAAAALTRIQLGHAAEPFADAPAVECLTCGSIESAGAVRCRCGGELTPAVIPVTLRGVFTFRRRLGAGGMGVVYKAWDQSLDRDVAVKALPRVTPEMASRLKHEARAMASVTHANLATVYGIETWQGTPLIVQEFLAGGTLSQRLNRAPMALPDALDLGITLADVLDHLHRHGVIHCDIKPSNIGFTQHGVVKLLDFGLARVIHEARAATTTGRLDASTMDRSGTAWEHHAGWFGTPHFMSPEAALGKPPAPSFDLWSLAVVLYEAIAGRRPFDGQSAFQILVSIVNGPTPDIRTVAADTPPPIAELLGRALSQDAACRPATGAAFASEMRGLRAAS